MAKAKNKSVLIVNIIILSIVALAVVFGIVTAFIKTGPAPKLEKPDTIQIITQGSLNSPNDRVDLTNKEDIDKFYNTYVRSTDFSAFRGILEYQWFKKAHITATKDEEGNKQLKTLNKNQLNAVTATTSSQDNASKYLIAFRYSNNDGPKTIKIDGKDIAYDTVFFVVRHTAGEIRSFKMYFVEFEKLIFEDFYETYEITAYGQLTKLYTLIEDILES
ncbi:MAG TPA: hypothetical protein VIL24_05730 [Clostridia bacterium]